MSKLYRRLSAWVYDLDKPPGRSFGDIEFLRARLADCRGPILEPAVGTGRVLIPLLEAGLTVAGFDASDEMLERCRANCSARGLSPRLDKMRFEDFAYDYIGSPAQRALARQHALELWRAKPGKDSETPLIPANAIFPEEKIAEALTQRNERSMELLE